MQNVYNRRKSAEIRNRLIYNSPRKMTAAAGISLLACFSRTHTAFLNIHKHKSAWREHNTPIIGHCLQQQSETKPGQLFRVVTSKFN
jgi:hypothetical protein